MGRGRQAAQAGQGGRSQSEAAGPSALARLGKRFARFRLERPRGTRYPDELRQGALALLGEVAPADVYRTCGISFGQVMAWKEAQARSPAVPDVRVFSVVDEAATPPPARKADESTAAPELELRLGPWSVRVRLVGAGPSERD